MIKAVLFDYGGVISAGGRGVEITERIAANLDISQERAFELLDIGWTLYASGAISEEEFWKQLETAFGKPIPVEKRDIWNSWDVMQPLAVMLDFVRELKRQNLQVGLLSNVIPYTMQQIREHGVYDEFDFAILSAEVGYGKPDKEIYELALQKLPGIQPEEVIFIDDQARFLEPAQALGMSTVLAVSSEQIVKDVTDMIKGAGQA
jgi:putative hydrolase of the HAD superfamily